MTTIKGGQHDGGHGSAVFRHSTCAERTGSHAGLGHDEAAPPVSVAPDLVREAGAGGRPDSFVMRNSGQLVDRGDAVKQLLWSVALETLGSTRPRPRVRLAARGLTRSRDIIGKWALNTQSSVRNSQVNGGFDISGQTATLNEWAHRHGVKLHRVVNEVTANQYPLLPLTSLHCHRISVAPVRMSMIILDDLRLGFSGPPFDSGESSLWVTDDRELLHAALDLARAQESDGHGITPLPPTVVNRRRLWVLIHLLNGLTDASIARRLDTSLRVVERDVHFIKDLAGVSTRLEIAWRLGFGGGS